MLNLLKKYLWLTVSTAVAFVLLAVIGSRLFFVFKSYQKEKQALNAAKTRIEELYQRSIFPSAANIIREKEKQDDLVDEYNELNSWLSDGQVLPEQMEAAEFMPFLENTLRRIRDQLQAGHVAFPDKYTFGFEKYAGGQLPMPKNIPRLIQQLKMTESICRVLPDSAISELIVFARDEFESVSGGTAPTRGAPPSVTGGAPAEELATQHFKMAFRAREGSAFDFLNRLARLPLFTVITWVEINNLRQETTLSGAGPSKPAADEKSKPAAKNQVEEFTREKRIILGREEVEVKLEMDVYNFGPFISFREGRAAKMAGK
ncbi:MAG: Amuc_1100 family pilus-like protein [Kiritimatiellia bacterium]|nr:Amuc_1100 family pilus-like protein [Kiritimatiellia bacterium]